MIRAVLATLLITAAPAHAGAPPVPTVVAKVVNVIDGDSIRVWANVWPGITISTIVRIDGVDTPEIRGKCKLERDAADAARDFVGARAGDTVLLRNVQEDKFGGRMRATVLSVTGEDIGAALIDAGLARPYHGQKREGWC